MDTREQILPKDREPLFVGLILLLALTVRLVYLFQVPETPLFHGLVMDSARYDGLAGQLLQGRLFHDDLRFFNPLYPYFLALIYAVFGHDPFHALVAQGILDVLNTYLVFSIGKRLFSPAVGLLAAGIYALYGMIIFYTGIVLAPTLAVFFTLVSLRLLLTASGKGRPVHFLPAGVTLGLLVLVRSNLVLAVLLLPLWILGPFRKRWGKTPAMQSLVLLLLGLSIVLGMSTLRNYVMAKHFSPFSIQGGINFYIGNNEQATGRFMSPYGVSSTPVEQVKTAITVAGRDSGRQISAAAASSYWFGKGLRFLADHPGQALRLYVKKTLQFWGPAEIPLNVNYPLAKGLVPVFDLPFISFAVVSPLSLIGLCLTIKRKDDVLLPTLFVLGGALSVILFFVSARYRLPVVPLLIVYAAWSIHRLALWLKGRDYKKAVAFTVSTACLAAVLGIGGTTTGETSLERASHYTNLGLVYLRQGRHDPGITELRKTLAISPSFAYARYNLGVALLEQGRFDDAVSQFSQAVRYRPGYAKAYYNMGLAYAAKGQTDQATAAFRKATALNPSYVEAHNNLGVAALSGRNYTEAANHFRKAIEVDPDFAEGHKNLAYTYWLLGERASAKRELGKLKSLNREMWKGLQRLLSQSAEE